MRKAHANALARLPMFFPDAPAVERSVLIGRTPKALAEAAERFGFDAVETDWNAALDEIDSSITSAQRTSTPGRRSPR